MSFEGFYPAIAATFVHIERNYGYEVLSRYWRELAEEYYRPVIEDFRTAGLDAIADHWEKYFSKEPQARFTIVPGEDRVVIDVAQCPAFFWLKHFKYEIPAWYCRHCEVMGNVLAEQSGCRFKFEGGDGSCKLSFISRGVEDAGSK